MLYKIKEVQNNFKYIKWNYTQDESMQNNKLTQKFTPNILEFDLEPWEVIQTDGSKSKHS